MTRTPYVPPELTRKPFTLSEARTAGLSLSSLRGQAWRRLGTELYCWHGLNADPLLVLSAWRDLLPADSVFVAGTAAWILGLDFDPTNPVAIAVTPGSSLRSRTGLAVHRWEIQPSEAVIVRELRTTTLLRTLLDICTRSRGLEALVAIDMAINLGLTHSAALTRYANFVVGRPGAGRFRSLVKLAGAAESPMETRLRWLLIQAGLPVPEIQIDLHDNDQQFLGRADLYYPARRVVIEYDGGNHRERLVEDNRRQNLLINAGFHLLRFTAADIYGRPDVIAAQVRGALGAPPFRAVVPKRAVQGADRRTVGAKGAESGRSWWRGAWRRGRDLNSRWASDP